jgi:hypothetical protein
VHFSEGGYQRIAVKLFNSVDVDTFYVSFWLFPLVSANFWAQLEYDNERSGDFSPLKHLPLNKVAVLGIVTTKSPKVGPFRDLTMIYQLSPCVQLEDAEALKARIHEAADIVAAGVPRRSKEAALNQCVFLSYGFSCLLLIAFHD